MNVSKTTVYIKKYVLFSYSMDSYKSKLIIWTHYLTELVYNINYIWYNTIYLRMIQFKAPVVSTLSIYRQFYLLAPSDFDLSKKKSIKQTIDWNRIIIDYLE